MSYNYRHASRQSGTFLPDESSIHYTSSPQEDNQAGEKEEMIKVLVRIKPQLPGEAKKNAPPSENTIRVIGSNVVQVANSEKEIVKSFEFEQVFNEKIGQEQVFLTSAAPLIKHTLMGYNSTIFVYGQTGTGKTHTMGLLNKLSTESSGILPLSIRYLFEYFNEVQEKEGDCYNWDLTISLMQIYLDDIIDLLNPKGGNLQIREDPVTHETYVQDLITVPVKNCEQAFSLLNVGMTARAQASQSMNQTSSRSHLIISIGIKQEFIDHDENKTSLQSTFTLIDLAGSERVRKTTSSGIRLEEAKSINSSLSALGNVISALRTSSVKFIPYRASKLTRVLQSSLNTDSKISLIATVSKLQTNVNETISTLLFASRCRDVQLRPQINTIYQLDLREDESFVDDRGKEPKPFSNHNSESVNKILTYESPQRNSVGINSAHRELLEYMLKLMFSLKKFSNEKIPELVYYRETYMKNMIEDVQNRLGNQRYQMNPEEAKEYLKRNEILEEIDLKFPRYPTKFTAEETEIDELLLLTQPIEVAIDEIQRTARTIIDNVNNLAINSLSAEKLKIELVNEKIQDARRESEYSQWQSLLTQLIRMNKDFYIEKTDLKFPTLSLNEKAKMLSEYDQQVQNMINTTLSQSKISLKASEIQPSFNFKPPVDRPTLSSDVQKSSQRSVAVNTFENSNSFSLGTTSNRTPNIDNIEPIITLNSGRFFSNAKDMEFSKAGTGGFLGSIPESKREERDDLMQEGRIKISNDIPINERASYSSNQRDSATDGKKNLIFDSNLGQKTPDKVLDLKFLKNASSNKSPVTPQPTIQVLNSATAAQRTPTSQVNEFDSKGSRISQSPPKSNARSILEIMREEVSKLEEKKVPVQSNTLDLSPKPKTNENFNRNLDKSASPSNPELLLTFQNPNVLREFNLFQATKPVVENEKPTFNRDSNMDAFKPIDANKHFEKISENFELPPKPQQDRSTIRDKSPKSFDKLDNLGELLSNQQRSSIMAKDRDVMLSEKLNGLNGSISDHNVSRLKTDESNLDNDSRHYLIGRQSSKNLNQLLSPKSNQSFNLPSDPKPNFIRSNLSNISMPLPDQIGDPEILKKIEQQNQRQEQIFRDKKRQDVSPEHMTHSFQLSQPRRIFDRASEHKIKDQSKSIEKMPISKIRETIERVENDKAFDVSMQEPSEGTQSLSQVMFNKDNQKSIFETRKRSPMERFKFNENTTLQLNDRPIFPKISKIVSENDERIVNKPLIKPVSNISRDDPRMKFDEKVTVRDESGSKIAQALQEQFRVSRKSFDGGNRSSISQPFMRSDNNFNGEPKKVTWDEFQII